MYRLRPDNILQKCVSDAKALQFVEKCHVAPYEGQQTAVKVLQSG